MENHGVKCKTCDGPVISRNRNANFCSDQCRSDFYSACKNLTDWYVRKLLANAGHDFPSNFMIEERRMLIKIKRELYGHKRKIDTQGNNGRFDDVLQGTDFSRSDGPENAIDNKPRKGYSNDRNSHASRTDNGVKKEAVRSSDSDGRKSDNKRLEENRIEMETNPFKLIMDKLDLIIQKLDLIEGPISQPDLIPLKQFCQTENISRPTAYAWALRGLIQLKKVGGRQYVSIESIAVAKKYKR